jgi:hypothetical protein
VKREYAGECLVLKVEFESVYPTMGGRDDTYNLSVHAWPPIPSANRASGLQDTDTDYKPGFGVRDKPEPRRLPMFEAGTHRESFKFIDECGASG